MWHEARRQEKKIRGLMVDYKKRAERRREFYEKIKADPAMFVRAFGQPCKINLDPAIALAAESPQSMMPWQGDTSNMIDRFDVRAHLDIMPPEKSYTVELTKEEEDEERRANYERYRILVENECAGLTEEQALHQIYIDEQFGAINKDGEEEKNKLRDKKAAIGYTYDDSTDGKKEEDDSSDSESEEEDVETLDLDIVIDVDTLNEDQIQQLNVCGTAFGMGKQDYIKYLRRDKDEQEALRQAKLLEEEKAQFAGRKSRRERRIYKEKRLAGRKLSPPSYAARDSPKYEPYNRSMSRSRSRSNSPPRRRRKLYITSFGGNESDEEEGVVQGPALPPGFGGAPETESTNQKPTASWESTGKKESIRKKLGQSLSPDSSPRSRDKEYVKRQTRSRSTSPSRRSGSRSRGHRSRSRSRGRRSSTSLRGRRSRSRSRGRRSSSRSRGRRSRTRSRGRRSRSRSRGRRSKSRSRGHYSRDRRSRERSRRSRSHDRWQRPRDRMSRDRSDQRSGERSRGYRSRSRSRKSRSNDRKAEANRYGRERSRSRSRSKRQSSSSSRSSSKSSGDSRSKSRSPNKPVVKRYRRESLSSKSSSDSDTSPTRKPVPPSYTRTKPGVPGSVGGKSLVPYGKPSSLSQPKLTPQERLKKKMQIALSRQYKADKKAEVLKHEKLEQEKMDREEELRQRAVEMRRRERERRHREMEAYGSDSDDVSSRGSSPPRRREKSPGKRVRKDNGDVPSKSKHRSRSRSRSVSRSRSRSPDVKKKKIVDY